MASNIPLTSDLRSIVLEKEVSPLLEIGAYESLWLQPGASFAKIAEFFRAHPRATPSEFIDPTLAIERGREVLQRFEKAGVREFGVRVHGAGEYPPKLRDAKHPVELLYFRGWWDLIDSRSVAVVGTREISEEGIRRTRKLVKGLVDHNFTIVSGLAKGVDSVAHRTAIERGGLTIAVPGTPLDECYPKENRELQELIAKEFLVISQVPTLLYHTQDYRRNRLFFPERNKTMSALTEATIIVEAGETSGTLIQAQAAFEQGRKLFILESCFNRPSLSWPARFEQKGAIRVRDLDDILKNLGLN